MFVLRFSRRLKNDLFSALVAPSGAAGSEIYKKRQESLSPLKVNYTARRPHPADTDGNFSHGFVQILQI